MIRNGKILRIGVDEVNSQVLCVGHEKTSPTFDQHNAGEPTSLSASYRR